MSNGYDFDGWYTAASGGTKITGSTAVTSSTTIYAHWIQLSTSRLYGHLTCYDTNCENRVSGSFDTIVSYDGTTINSWETNTTYSGLYGGTDYSFNITGNKTGTVKKYGSENANFSICYSPYKSCGYDSQQKNITANTISFKVPSTINSYIISVALNNGTTGRAITTNIPLDNWS